ncbi:MAG: phospholipid/cholesterol/gamma-HCH transport system substrate-binding protein [Thermoleophilaceae bacterium]|nr:phospholipid/cholesterol/gamma-HCH transport system substrate-binding protein [Thermoleophilaceae bacterium]
MSARALIAGALALAAIAVGVILVAGSGPTPYRVQLDLQNAAGLRDGSEVSIGGVRAGQVSLHLAGDDQVVAQLDIDPEHAPVGRDASAAISAVNFLGQKRVEIVPGNLDDPAPTGTTIPAARITSATDLDQVLSVLDTDTRARLGVLLSESGLAVQGRRQDLAEMLKELPVSVSDATQLLNQLSTDNTTLARLMTESDRFVGEVTRQRAQLTRLIDNVGQTATTVAARRDGLRATLAEAPGTLSTLQTFLAKLEDATKPLGPAARDLSDTAPRLQDVIDEIDPFRRAAQPALRSATAVAPDLSRLGNEGTPVLTKAVPALDQLSTLSKQLMPISNTLDRSADNLLAVIENWSRAIQFRDGMSHVFRGEAAVGNEALRSMVDRLTAGDPKHQESNGGPESRKASGAGKDDKAQTSGAAPSSGSGNPVKDILDGVKGHLDKAGKDLGDLSRSALDKVKGGVKKVTDKVKGAAGSHNAGDLLNYLLGP